MTEYWDVYNEKRELTGKTIERGAPLGEDEYYVSCEVWITNAKGEMLITKRHPNKKLGGMWEFTGGGVLAGETTREAAKREVREELGIVVEEEELKLLGVYRHKRYFMDIYLVEKNVDIKEITLEENEVTECAWVSKDTVEQMIDEQKIVYSVGVRYKMYGK